MKNKEFQLYSLYLQLQSCTKCRLSKTRNNVVCGEGNINSKIFIVAQAPGQHEDKSGKIFVGPAGKIFDSLLNLAGLNRNDVFITNLVKCFLPKYRRPKWDEIYACKNYLFQELKIINPLIIIPLGYYSTRTILEYYHFPTPERRNEYHKIFGKVFTRDKIIYPLPHPALIFHDSSRFKGMKEAYKKIKELQSIKGG